MAKLRDKVGFARIPGLEEAFSYLGIRSKGANWLSFLTEAYCDRVWARLVSLEASLLGLQMVALAWPLHVPVALPTCGLVVSLSEGQKSLLASRHMTS